MLIAEKKSNVIELAVKNFPAQQSIFDDPHPTKIVVKGRRFGLTKGAANDFIQCGLQGKFSFGLWVDTINANIDKYVNRYFLPELRKLPENMWTWRKQERVLYIKDAYIDFRSVDKPENIEGFAYDKAFLNEAGIILKDKYLWYNSIRPMLMEYNPKTVIGGTPKGKNTFFDLAARAKDGGEDYKDYSYFHFTSYDNPYIPKWKVDNMAFDMPETSRKQEVFAEFLDDGGEVFRHVRVAATAVPLPPQNGHYYTAGVDLAKVQDWTVIAIYDRTTNQQVYQDRFQTLEWPFQKKRIQEIAKYYNNALVTIDATGLGDPIVDDLMRAGLAVNPFKISNESKKEIIEKLSIWIEQGKCRMINMPETMEEFDNFSYDISKSGKIMYNAREGFHDDIVIAHALAVWDLHELRPDRPEVLTPIRRELQKAIKEYQYGPESEQIEFI